MVGCFRWIGTASFLSTSSSLLFFQQQTQTTQGQQRKATWREKGNAAMVTAKHVNSQDSPVKQLLPRANMLRTQGDLYHKRRDNNHKRQLPTLWQMQKQHGARGIHWVFSQKPTRTTAKPYRNVDGEPAKWDVCVCEHAYWVRAKHAWNLHGVELCQFFLGGWCFATRISINPSLQMNHQQTDHGQAAQREQLCNLFYSNDENYSPRCLIVLVAFHLFFSFSVLQSGDAAFTTWMDSLNIERDFERAKPLTQSRHLTTMVAHCILTVKDFVARMAAIDRSWFHSTGCTYFLCKAVITSRSFSNRRRD